MRICDVLGSRDTEEGKLAPDISGCPDLEKECQYFKCYLEDTFT